MAYILVLDQGTTSSRSLLVDSSGRIVGSAQRPFRQIYPQPGWVEHDPDEIWSTQFDTMKEVVQTTGVPPREIAAIGLANQRETVVAWDRRTGRPISNAIVWQCRRTTEICERLKTEGWSPRVQERTGLVIDSYFSAPKIAWLLQNHPDARRMAAEGSLLVGTVDSWLLWKLTGGQAHATDASNASRTMLYDIHHLRWDEELADALSIPLHILPEVKASNATFGTLDPSLVGAPIPITAVLGDQQAALFGQACFHPGMAKATYGTGAFLLMQTGKKAVPSSRGLLTTIAWNLDGEMSYALEGSIFIAGAAVQWLRDELQLIAHAADSEEVAASVPDTGGVYVVPAFVGLGAPHWIEEARGTIVGLTRGSNRSHIVRAVLESIAYQVRDVLEAMQGDAAIALNELRVDGGASANNFLMQFQADILGVNVRRPASVESTAIGAAYLAGLGSGLWKDLKEIEAIWTESQAYAPQMPSDDVERLYAGWQRAVHHLADSVK